MRFGRLAHLGGRFLQVVDLRHRFDDVGLRYDERLPEPRVEALRKVSRQLDVLALILAHGHVVGLVEQNVGRLQDRVGEQPDAGVGLLGRLVLELRHPACFTETRDAAQHPRELCVLGDLALHEQRAPLRVEPGAQQLRRRDASAGAQHRRVVVDRDGVQVDHAVKGLVAVLQ